MLQIPANLRDEFLEHAAVGSKQSIIQFAVARLKMFMDRQKPVVVGFRYKNEYCELTGSVVEVKNDYVVIADKWDYLAVDLQAILFVELLENIQALDHINS